MTESNQSTERPLRRLDRLLTEEEALEVVRHTDHAVLGTVDAAGFPYAVPISPVWVDGALYFHCSKSERGRRTANLRQNPRVSVCFVGRAETAVDELPDNFSVNYASAIVAGRAELVTGEAERRKIALALGLRHGPVAGARAVEAYYEAFGQGIAIWKITVDSVSGKARSKQGYFNKLLQGA